MPVLIFLLNFFMSKVDFELLQQAPSFLNAVRDRELDLRGNKFQRIENLILTKDQHDTLNVTDNDLRILDNFPYMPRLKNIMAANNRITKLSLELYKYIPNLTCLILTNSQLSELGGLLSLENFEQSSTDVGIHAIMRVFVQVF